MVKVPVILCFDDRILIGAGVTIQSMLDSAAETTTYDIHILHPGMGTSATNALEALVEGSRHTLSFTQMPASRFENVPANKGSWTEIVYYRLLASEFLPECDKAIYSDVDVYVTRDLADVFAVDLSDAEWAGVAAEANRPENTMHRYFPENSKDKIYFSGFMVMNLAMMRQNGAITRYFEVIDTCRDRLKFFDLDVLNIATPNIVDVPFDYVVLEEVYEGKSVTDAKDYSFLSSIYSEEELEKARQNPAIIHYAGKRGKPWQRRQVPAYYQAAMDRLPAALCRKTFRDWRKTWLSKKGHRRYYLRSATLDR